MIGYIFGLATAFFSATYYALIKKYSKGVSEYTLAVFPFLFASPFVFIYLVAEGFPTVPLKYWFVVFLATSVNLIAVLLYVRALKISELTLTIPMLAFTPLFMLATSPIITKEFPTLYGLIGLLLIVFGSYILNLNHYTKGILAPLKAIYHHKGPFLMLIVAFIFSLGANFDRLGVTYTSPGFHSFIMVTCLGLALLVVALFESKKSVLHPKISFKIFLFIGLVLALTIIFQNNANKLIIAPYVISLKRVGILFSMFYGYLFFKEKHLKRRTFAAVIMVIGAIIITVMS